MSFPLNCNEELDIRINSMLVHYVSLVDQKFISFSQMPFRTALLKYDIKKLSISSNKFERSL